MGVAGGGVTVCRLPTVELDGDVVRAGAEVLRTVVRLLAEVVLAGGWMVTCAWPPAGTRTVGTLVVRERADCGAEVGLTVPESAGRRIGLTVLGAGAMRTPASMPATSPRRSDAATPARVSGGRRRGRTW